MKLSGQVEHGKLIPDSLSAWVIALQAHEGRRVTVEIERERPLRSLRANSFYWAVLNPLAGHVLDKSRDPNLPPLHEDQIHFVLVSAFAGSDVTELGPVPVRTRTMDVGQFSIFTERVQAWLAEKGIPVPAPGEAVVEEGA